jgi:hypothetical protein
VTKIKGIKRVQSVKSLMTLEERKQVDSGSTLIKELTSTGVPSVKLEILKVKYHEIWYEEPGERQVHNAKGKVEEMVREITDNPKLEAKGKTEKIAGNIQEKIGQIEIVLGK